MQEPSAHEIHKTCWNTSTLDFYVKTFTGFASKQKVPFEVNVKNPRNVKILKLIVILIQVSRYYIMILIAFYEHNAPYQSNGLPELIKILF